MRQTARSAPGCHPARNPATASGRGGGWWSRSRSGTTWRARSELNERAGRACSRPNSVFRIDHYLGKETVQNILALRFANTLFEPIWNRNYVDHVQITMAEDIGIGGRAGYYDGHRRRPRRDPEPPAPAAGADRDGGAGLVRRRRRCGPRRRRCSRPIQLPGGPGRPATARGQYAGGWPGGSEVAATWRRTASRQTRRTETYAAVKLGVDTRRWAGVPFYLRTGKRLAAPDDRDRRRSSSARRTCRSRRTDTEELGPQRAGDPGAAGRGRHRCGSARRCPAPAMEVRDVNMDFAYGESFTETSPEAYERLILDVLIGDPPLFPGTEEVELSWKVLDPIVALWARQGPPSGTPRVTWGPPGRRRRSAGPRRPGMAPTRGG